MSSKQKFIILSSLITLIIIIIYTPIRTGMIETDYMKSLISSSKKIALSLERFEKEKNLKNKNLTKFCKLVKGKFPNIALIIISDKENRELKVGKNNKYIKTNKTFDSIIESFRNDEFKIHENSEFIIRYFNQIKFYLFVKNLKSGKILMIFPYKLSNKLFIVLILEILLIIIISIIITSFIYIKQRKELPLDETPDDRIIDESQEEEKPVSKEIKKEKKKKKSKNISTSTIDHLDDYISELFDYISSEYSIEELSLYLKNKETLLLDKIYELKGKTFIKTDGAGISSIDYNNEIGDELKKSSILVQEKGKKITLPILHRDSLAGIINIIGEKEFSGPEINDIKTHVTKIAKPLSQHLLSE